MITSPGAPSETLTPAGLQTGLGSNLWTAWQSREARTAASVATAAAATAILLAPALWNGFPLLQYDTGGYLARWYEGTLVPSRPGAYGLMLALTGAQDFWPTLILQGAATVWMLSLILRVHGLGGRPLVLLAVTALLSALTTLPWLTSILLTDIFAGLGVLALHLLIMRGNALKRTERAALFALVGFAGATHSATIALLACLVACAMLCAWKFGSLISRDGAVRGLVALGLSLLVTFTANFAVSGRLAWTPGGSALLFGRMLQDGIVDRYLGDHCPDSRLRLCMYRKELPRTADEWFWGSNLFDEMGRFAGLGEEMSTIAIEAVRKYPWLQTKAAISATARQLVSVSSGEGVGNRIWHTYVIIEKFTPSAAPAMRAAYQQSPGLGFWPTINRIHLPVALGSTLFLTVFLYRRVRQWRLDGLGALAATVTAALLANAVICGILSNPHDRYGARLVWLAAFVLIVVVARNRVRAADHSPSGSFAEHS